MSSADPTEHRHQAEDIWRTYMATGQMPDYLGAPWFMKRFMRPVARWLPSDPRRRICDYPFQGVGGFIARTLFGLAPSKMNPQLCNNCEAAAHEFRGGAEVEMSLLFVDVTGFFVPGIAGPEHARLAVEAGEEILRVTGTPAARHSFRRGASAG